MLSYLSWKFDCSYYEYWDKELKIDLYENRLDRLI